MKLIVLCVAILAKEIVASDLCQGEKCVQKCCPEEFYVLLGKCISYPEKVGFKNLTVYSKGFKAVGQFEDFFKIKAGAFLDQKFRNRSFRHDIMYKTYHLMENGDMFMEKKRAPIAVHEFRPDEYCIDYKMIDNDTLGGDLVVYFKNKDHDVGNKGNHVTLKWGFLISCVFLFLVLVVYSLLPELRNLGGLILMAYVASLMLGFIFLFSIQIGSHTFVPLVCLIITCLTYFFLLASFCWLNVMSYDIWWTFRGYAKARPINRRGENIKFLIYCAYAFGIPLGLTAALATLNEVNAKHPLKGIVPQIPLKGCFVEGWAKYVYLYAPMLIMILANWVFFVMTAFNIWRLSRGSDVLRAADSSASGSASAHKNSKQRLIVYLKLSVLMGLSWILEVVSSSSPDFGGWYITDCYNVLIGVVIFIIFVCKRKVLNMLKKRYTNFRHTHKFSFQSKGRSRSSQDETNTQSLPLQSPNCSTVTTKFY
ncbi:hypothetical protein ABMA28_016716 [Loxostege sticticalis]|uniref:G-protein coupled receptors family 2 profile 2 domain-containing protein n=1 Tax=Loxostege sticticalis TaxID=481309 RepID=A0ABD0T5K1_LOXSC